jgi:phage tail-like protein
MADVGTTLSPDAGVLAKNFSLTVDGIGTIGFTEISGMTSEVDVTEVKQSKDGKYVIDKLANSRKPPTLQIKRPKDKNLDLWKWHKLALDGNMQKARRSGQITLHDTDLGAVAKWTFQDAWCSKLSISSVGAGKNEVVMEEATIVMSGLIETE